MNPREFTRSPVGSPRRILCLGLLAVVVLSGCAARDGARTPIPILADRVPPASRDEDVARHLADYMTGDESRIHGIEGRLNLLVPRPWTVERLAAYAAASLDPQEHADLVYLLAASKDLLGLRVAGLALHHPDLEVRMAAAQGIELYWIEVKGGGNAETTWLDAEAFWKAYRDRLLNEP